MGHWQEDLRPSLVGPEPDGLATTPLEWARETDGVSRVELEVFPHDARAIHPYTSMGFELGGRRRRAFVKEGVALDALVMGILL